VKPWARFQRFKKDGKPIRSHLSRAAVFLFHRDGAAGVKDAVSEGEWAMPKAKRVDESRAGTKRRRRGYRGYGSPLGRDAEQFGGAVHWGRGFAGIGFPGESGSMLPRESELFPDDLRTGDRK
jgi:hypothetical protein